MFNTITKKRFLNKQELAIFLGISKFTIDAWVSQRRVPFVKMGKRVLFDIEDIEKWINQNKVAPINIEHQQK